ncbi:MAG: MFS transporter [Burkholderiaceae bacterium]|nr:MFS transporter [Burkholderiaceae bacterium]
MSAGPRASDAARTARTSAAVRALLFGNFAIGAGVMVVAGMLGDLALGLGVSVPTAGQLITLAAFVTCVGAPLSAALTSRIDRRALLAGSLVFYAFGHLLCALAPGYTWLALARAFTVVSAAIFTPQAAATIALIAPPAERSKAVSAIFVGWSIASVLGMPIGNLLGAYAGWRWGFGAAALLAAVGAIWVRRTIPAGLTVPPLSAAAWRAVADNRLLVGVLAVTLLSAAGQFTLFAYIAPALTAATQASPAAIAGMLGLFGAFGVIGNMWTARHIGRRGPDRAVAASLAAIMIGVAFAMAVTLALAPGVLPPLAARWTAWPLLFAACLFWGLGCFAMNSAQQARLAAIAPALASASIALNTSGMYGGQAIGAGLGGALIAAVGMGALPWVAGALLALTARLSSRLRGTHDAPAHGVP